MPQAGGAEAVGAGRARSASSPGHERFSADPAALPVCCAASMVDPLQPYLPLAIVLLVAGGMAVAIVGISSFLGPRRPSLAKSETFECGSETVGSARQRFAVKFYVVALLFIVFDVEA